MAILAFLIAVGCTPSLRPHDRARGISVTAVESAGKAMISITARNAARSAGWPREDLFSAAKSAARKILAERRAAPPTAPQAPSVIPITVGYRLHGER